MKEAANFAHVSRCVEIVRILVLFPQNFASAAACFCFEMVKARNFSLPSPCCLGLAPFCRLLLRKLLHFQEFPKMSKNVGKKHSCCASHKFSKRSGRKILWSEKHNISLILLSFFLFFSCCFELCCTQDRHSILIALIALISFCS